MSVRARIVMHAHDKEHEYVRDESEPDSKLSHGFFALPISGTWFRCSKFEIQWDKEVADSAERSKIVFCLVILS